MVIDLPLDPTLDLPLGPLTRRRAASREYRAAAVARAVVMSRAAELLVGAAAWTYMAPLPGGLLIVLGPGTTIAQAGRAVAALEADGWILVRVTLDPRRDDQTALHTVLPPDLQTELPTDLRTDMEGPTAR
ncbi:hypothetical protein [Actinomadura nitritigenes]|uniref:hypothetical protein n=1 Tax=Actinomadura nitritigenes TaxID=134602 RepID=UPI003D93D59F